MDGKAKVKAISWRKEAGRGGLKNAMLGSYIHLSLSYEGEKKSAGSTQLSRAMICPRLRRGRICKINESFEFSQITAAPLCCPCYPICFL